jgi:hypothetical protein
MIVVIANAETDPSGNRRLVTSHGVDLVTDRIVILPNEHPAALGAVLDCVLGEYVIRGLAAAGGSSQE